MKIKFNIINLLAVLFLIAGSSCSLDEDPKYSLTSTTVFNSESSAEAVLMQNYGWLGNAALYGQYIHEVTAANGVYWSKTDGDRFERAIKYDMYAEHSLLSSMWTGFYRIISESNYLIKGMQGSSLTEEYKTRATAHARFLRGYAYFELANLFGKAVLLTEPVTTSSLHSPLSSRESIYQQAINDFIYASENLPLTETMDGLATKDAAIAFTAKCYWIMANHSQADGNDASSLYTQAKTYGDKVIGKFALEAKFSNLWVNHTNNSPESIFQINFTDAIGLNLRSTYNFGPSANFGRISALQPSFGNFKIDRAFYDLHRGTYPDDPRLASTYLSRWVNASNTTQTYFSYPLYNTGTVTAPVVYDMYASAPRKSGNIATNPDYNFDTGSSMPNGLRTLWNNTGTNDRNLHPLNNKMLSTGITNAQYDPKNLILFRYADLLLLMADVENELGNSGQALTYLNQVLTRARTSTATALYPQNQTALNKEEMRDKIFFERMFEMAGEPNLYEDIRRRGTTYLKKVIEIHNNSKNVQYRTQLETANNVGGLFRDFIINNGVLTEDFLKKNLVLPIPLDEINNNNNISQEDQNFGY
ncbi:RagB/SusD family nutrient uptake outer membrane protein [uncultured Flavobacterium sp.]|uniref:RagB/SusD family nutrient uptake outer membrane protein n=1 Tax=uncultured Flavobacterium sp. TaxID=165435 RepID=UPI0025CC096B|nr:RagB/SusD family nutrient uptake outer membrane protein [uncultured Flavobacterium sp.]